MGTLSSLKIAVLATSIALAMASTAAMSATPTTTQLPGLGVATGIAAGSTAYVAPVVTNGATAGTQNIVITGNTVIDWGKAAPAGGTTINADQPGGFNVGSASHLSFTGDSVLNIDVSGNASQIFGHLTQTGTGNLYVANANGIIVGAGAVVSSAGDLGMIANTIGTVAFDGTAYTTSIEYNGAGGNVSVAKAANISGANVLVSGGGVVNVDLSAFNAGALTLQVGIKNSASSLASDNISAMLSATGTLATPSSLVSFTSAGNASNAGTLTLDGDARVDGTLTNTGDLTLGTTSYFNIAGGLVNSNTVTLASDAFVGSLVNSGLFDGGGKSLTMTTGGVKNSGLMTNLGGVGANGAFTNDGQIVANNIGVYGADFVNNGTLSTVTNGVNVENGSIINTGHINAKFLYSISDANDPGFTKGATYSITNSGFVTSTSNLTLAANSTSYSYRGLTANDSLGNVINTGTLQLGKAAYLTLAAYGDVSLGGNVQAAASPGAYKVLSANNALNYLNVSAGDYDAYNTHTFLNKAGTATISADIVASHGALIAGNQVKLLANFSLVDSTNTPILGTYLQIFAGPRLTNDYAVRLAAGKTITADNFEVYGDAPGDAPNVIVQGTLAANDIFFGIAGAPVSDVFTGPAGKLSLFNDSTDPILEFIFTGSVKTVPYNNDSNNFRFNGMPVVTDGSPLLLVLNPVAYTTNGTSNNLSAVNLLVNSDVTLLSPVAAPFGGNGSAVTGVTTIPNTHLVLQSNGNITVGSAPNPFSVSGFYWPGYVYLGNVSADAKGNALPGTLGLGTITTVGNFNNVLPGDTAGASGIHFITQFPLTLDGDVVTNANALVSFGTDLLTQAYASGTLKGNFFGGMHGPGTVVNYGTLDPSLFATQAPVGTR